MLFLDDIRLDTPTSSFETPIYRGHETPKGTRDDNGEHVDSNSKRRHAEDDDDDDFDKESVTTAASNPRSKYFHPRYLRSFSKCDECSCFAETARDLRLDQYLSINTSEDNISFEQIMDETQKKERTKVHQAWLYQQQALTHAVGSLPHSLDRKIDHDLSFSADRVVEMDNCMSCQYLPSRNNRKRTIPIKSNSGRIP